MNSPSKSSLDQRTIETLEFPKIVACVAGNCLTPYGSEMVSEIASLTVIDEIKTHLREAEQLKDILKFGDPFPLTRAEDIRPLIAKSQIDGSRIEAEDFGEIRETLILLAKLKVYGKNSCDNATDISKHLSGLGSFQDLRKSIERAIDEDGAVRDTASAELRKIRMELAETRNRLIKKLEAALAKRTKSPGWQDDVVTQRGDRFVIPVQASQYTAGAGIIQDRSQTGATLFIEPTFAVELNNRLTLLAKEERDEIDRILRALTAQVKENSDSLSAAIETLGLIDTRHAVALFAIKTSSFAPEVVPSAEIDLINARHPLLVLREVNLETIPLDLELGNNRQGIIITGPNTGGKTVALKTVGLLALMTSAGIPIPADARSKVGIFTKIYADIGDEQSIEQSLSTFSSHISKVIEGVNNADNRTLLLFDEIGAGTDPKEGAALAEAVILDIIKRGAKLIVTTHYTQLKTLPLSHPELENASMEFNKETLSPTYRLLMGLPGSSYATEIAIRLGMPRRIVKSALEKLDEGERSLAELIESLGNELKQVRDDSVKLSDKLSAATELESSYESKLDEFKKEVSELKEQAAEEAEELLTTARKDIENAVKEIRQTQASKESIKKAKEKIQSGLSQINKQREERPRPTGPARSHGDPLKPGDTVWLRSLKKDGELIELMGEKRARVRIGAIINIVDLDDLLKATTPEPRGRPSNYPAGLRVETDPAPEIHLRGMTVEEATEKLDKFLDSAMLAGLPQVYVIHGKGAGILRKALTKFLKDHPGVESVRLGDWNQGGVGVTVAKMK